MAPISLSSRVASVIEAHLGDPGFGVGALARALGCSRSWLHRRLVDDGGLPPGARIRQARLRRAVVLLQEPDRPVAEVAAAVGYGDPAHFTRSFKRAFGEAPSRFRTGRMPQNPATGAPGQRNGKSPQRPFNREARGGDRLE